jgi:hypothetical protein
MDALSRWRRCEKLTISAARVKRSRQTIRLASTVVSGNYSAGYVWATKMYLGFTTPPFTRESLTC